MSDLLNPNQADLDPRHDLDSRPLQETSRAISALSEQPVEGMDPIKKSALRQQILDSTAPKPMPAPVPAPSKPPFRLHLWPAFAFAGLAAVFLLAIIVNRNPNGILPSASPSSIGGELVKAISIPSAHAADAFSILADKSDTSGIAADASFTVTSNVTVTADDLRQALRIVPPIDVDYATNGDGSIHLTPKEPLDPGTVYHFTIATKIEDGDAPQAREFSFALQTKNDFRVLSVIPRDGASRVPTNTGIEFKVSRTGWVDPTSHFTITPSVKGQFVAHGRSLTFVPEKPLAEGTVYEAVLKKGFNISGSDLALAKDIRIRFETDSTKLSTAPAAPIYLPISERFQIVPNKPADIDVYLYDKTKINKVKVTAYKLDHDAALGLLKSRLDIAPWTVAEKEQFADFERAAKTQSFTLDANLVSKDYRNTLTLPPISEAGFYAMRFDPIAPGKAVKASWSFFQVTDAATYLKADKDTLVVWAVNPSTNRPLSNLALRMDDQNTQTDAQGMARLKTPGVLTTTSTTAGDVYPYTVLDVGTGDLASFVIIRKTYDIYYFDFGNPDTQVSNTFGYLYLDRPLYRQSDELKLFGLAQDRDTHSAPTEPLTARLRKSNYWYDWNLGGDKVYQEIDLHPDSSGRFDGTFKWDSLSQGYYTIETRRGDRTVSSRTFEVREFVKPAYSIEVTPDQDSVYAGDKVSGTVRVRFFDGTPVPKQSLSLAVRGMPIEVSQELKTDSDGVARFEFVTNIQECRGMPTDQNPGYESWMYSCYADQYTQVEVHPTSGEEGEIVGSSAVLVRRGSIGMNVDFEGGAGKVDAKITTWNYSLTADDAGRSNPAANQDVGLTVLAWHWERVSTGFEYDPIEKKNIEQFRYEPRYDPIQHLDAKTDSSGHLTHTYETKRGNQYVLFVDTKDAQGRKLREARYFWDGGYGTYGPSSPDANQNPELVLTPAPKDATKPGFNLGDQVTAEFRIGDAALDVSKTPGVLFLLASRGLRDAKAVQSNQYSFRYEENLVPNAEIYAVTWKDGHFLEIQNTAVFKTDARELTLEAIPDKTSYIPGETVNVSVTAKLKQSGEPVRDLKVAYGAVDKALLALSGDNPAQPLNDIYGWVADGMIFTSRSHEVAYDGFGGAEKGGGGGDSLRMSARKNFKDTAAFGVVQADSNGVAHLTFQAPDNITGWRFEVVGISGNLDAGAGRADVNVTKPVFVDVVLPPRLLASDKPVIKLRAFGAGLPQNEPVTFIVDAPSLGINNQRVSGKALEPTFVAVDTLTAGHHLIDIGVESAQGKDALERGIDITLSNFTKNEFVSIDAAPGSALPDLGVPEADLVLTAKNRASLLPYFYGLTWTWSSRSDAIIAQRYALSVLRNIYQEKSLDSMPSDSELATKLTTYQEEGGNMMLLPYASTDAELTAEVAMTAPEMVDRTALGSVLWQQLDASQNREQQLQALAGLAALGEPVLPTLQATASIKDLNWREQLAVANGLDKAGDRERARGLLDALLKKSAIRDNLTRLEVSDKLGENVEATADAAALAASLAHPQAPALQKYVDSVWTNDAFPVLAKVRYLKAVLPTVLDRPIHLSYTFGTDEKNIDFSNQPVWTLKLTSDEAKKFRITSVDGPVALTFLRRTAGKPESKPEIAISRTYQPGEGAKLEDLHEGDSITITLHPEWKQNALTGCYEVTDHLPGGWQALVSHSYGYYGQWYPSRIENGAVSFYACNYSNSADTIVYKARVVSRGSYTAEAPLIQHEEFPSIEAVGNDQKVIIK